MSQTHVLSLRRVRYVTLLIQPRYDHCRILQTNDD
jgi:hypothetical protein